MFPTDRKPNSANGPLSYHPLTTAPMTAIEMVQNGPPMSAACPRTPPTSPDLAPAQQAFTLNDAQQFIEIVKAVMDMQIASAPAPKCTCSHTPPEVTSADLCSPTPCHTFPTNQPSAQIVTTEHVQQFLDILKSLSAKQGPPPPPGKPSKATGDAPSARASRLEFKTVHEVCVFCEFQVHPCCS
jgi:hypothetical protein